MMPELLCTTHIRAVNLTKESSKMMPGTVTISKAKITHIATHICLRGQQFFFCVLETQGTIFTLHQNKLL